MLLPGFTNTMKKILKFFIIFAIFTFCVKAQTVPVVTASPVPSQTVSLSSPETASSSPVNPETAPEVAISKVTGESPVSRYVAKDAAARIPRFESAPVIDGQLNDSIWQNAAVFGDFLQISPGDNVKPTHPTEFMMGYDAKNLYLAFRIIQDRKTVRATVARRDNIANDDYVLVHLDTFNVKPICYFSIRWEYRWTALSPKDAAKITRSTS
jgi:hypothetical protein